jgi:hypothetical protein
MLRSWLAPIALLTCLGSANAQNAAPPNGGVAKLEPAIIQARACIRANLKPAYDSGAYTDDEILEFFRRHCLADYRVGCEHAGFPDMADATFNLFVVQEVSPKQYQRFEDALRRRLGVD